VVPFVLYVEPIWVARIRPSLAQDPVLRFINESLDKLRVAMNGLEPPTHGL
jgi:hypothetical protein